VLGVAAGCSFFLHPIKPKASATAKVDKIIVEVFIFVPFPK
jgi:hypothetical protein